MKALKLLQKKKWAKALALLEHAERVYKPNVQVLAIKGNYHLLAAQIDSAKTYFEKALLWNPRLDVQKELGWINLEMGNYPTAISLISDHLHRNPTDEEAYNLLLQCYYQTSRYETAIALAKTLLEVNSKNPCFINNLYVCSVLHLKGKAESTENIFNSDLTDTPFLKYNKDLLAESEATHDLDNAPTLKSKLLFMDCRFRNYIPSTLYLTIGNITGSDEYALQQPIITFGREGYAVNDVQVFGGISISRRHCIIINFKDDLWLYDLSSTGTYLNGNRIHTKAPLVGRNTIRIGKTEYELTNDKRKLL